MQSVDPDPVRGLTDCARYSDPILLAGDTPYPHSSNARRRCSYYSLMASKADSRVRTVIPLVTCLALLIGGCASSTRAIDGDASSPPASSSIQDSSIPSAESESKESTAGKLLTHNSDPETDARAMLVSVIEALKQSDIETIGNVRWDAEGASVSAVPLTFDGPVVEEVPFYYDGAQFKGDFETLGARKGTETTAAGVYTAAELEELLPKIDALLESAAAAFESANAVKTEGGTLDNSALELRGYLRHAEEVGDGKCYFRAVVQQYLIDTGRLVYEVMDGMKGSLTGYPITSDSLIVEGSTCRWK